MTFNIKVKNIFIFSKNKPIKIILEDIYNQSSKEIVTKKTLS